MSLCGVLWLPLFSKSEEGGMEKILFVAEVGCFCSVADIKLLTSRTSTGERFLDSVWLSFLLSDDARCALCSSSNDGAVFIGEGGCGFCILLPC